MEPQQGAAWWRQGAFGGVKATSPTSSKVLIIVCECPLCFPERADSVLADSGTGLTPARRVRAGAAATQAPPSPG